METKYKLGKFTIKDKNWVNSYIRERKSIYFKYYTDDEVLNFINEHNIGKLYDVVFENCKESDLKGVYPTDGFSSIVRVKEDNVIGWIDVRHREFLVRWEKREHDGEYAKVLKQVNFIITDTDDKSAGVRADEYAVRMRYAYADSNTFYTITDNEKDIEEVKKNESFVTIN